jgi:hypothetical protein
MKPVSMNNRILTLLLVLLCILSNGCAVVGVASAAVSVASTAVSIGATVVGTTVDVAAAGIRAVTPGKSDSK